MSIRLHSVAYLDRVVSGAREADDGRVVVAVGDEDGDVDGGRESRLVDVRHGDQHAVDARPLAVQSDGGRQTPGPPVDDERADRRRLNTRHNIIS